MDNLTHTLTGVLLARAGLSRLSPRAVWISAIAANIPDIDVVSFAGGTETYFQYHRWITHSVILLPVMAMAAVAVVALVFRRKLPWLRAWVVALAAVASHLLLDSTNPYGIRLWLPFSDAWPALEITHVVDLWIWTILLLGVFWSSLSRLVASEIGAKAKPARGAAVAALVGLLVYDTGRFFLHTRALQVLESRIYQGQAPRRTVAFPRSVNPLGWTGWVETDNAWMSFDVNLAREFDAKPMNVFWKSGAHRAIDAVRPLPAFQTLLKFARTPFWRVTPSDDPAGADSVELIDLRFGGGGGSGFTATAVVDGDNRVLRTGFHF